MNEYDQLLSGKTADDYDALIAADADQGQQRLRASMTVAQKQNPDQYGQAKQIERKTGLPAPIGARNLPEVQLKANLNEFDKLLATSPVLARQLQSADFASMSHDDIANLSETEFLLGAQENGRYSGGKIGGPAFRRHGVIKQSVGPEPSFSSVVMGLAKSFGQGAEKAGLGLKQQAADVFSNEESSAAISRRRQQIDFEEFLSTPAFESSTARGLYSGGTSTLRVLPGVVGAVATRNPWLGLSAMGLQTETEAYGKYRARGGKPGESFAGAVGEGVTEVVTERLPMGFLVSRFGKVGAGQFLAGLLAREVPTEQVATLVQDAIDTAVANPDKTWQEYVAERPDAAYQTLLATLVQSGVMSAGHTVAQRFMDGQAAVQHAEETSKALEQLSALSEASKVRERDPQTFAEFVDAAAAEGEVQQLYVDARVFAQAAGENLPEIVVASPSVAAQIGEAVAAGGDLVIPIGEYAAGIAPTDFNKVLMPHLRTSEEAMSMEEAKTFMQSQAEEFKREAAKVLEQQEFDTAFKQSAETVEKELLAQLRDANRFTDDVNTNYAKLMASFYTVQAARLGITPEEMYVKYPLNIRAEPVTKGNVMDQTEDDRIIGERMAELVADVDAAEQTYNALPESQGGRILDTDIARELSPDYRSDRTKSGAVHPAASKFIKQLYTRRLAEVESPRVLFTAGGTGAGKSTAVSIPSVAAAHDDADIVYDTTMSGYEGAKASVEEALKAGGLVDIALVIRDPVEALVAGALPRAMKQEQETGSGRTVEIGKFVEAHEGAMQTVFRLADEYAGNPDVNFVFIDNTHGRGNAREISLADAKGIVYNDIGPKVRAALEQEYADRKISDAVYAGFKSGEAPTREAEADRGAAGEPGQADREQPQQQREGPEGQVAPGAVFAQETIDNKTGEPDAQPPFFSMLARLVEQAKMKVAPASQWKAFINSLSSKGVKKEEIVMSGVLDWLDTESGEAALEAAKRLTIGDYLSAKDRHDAEHTPTKASPSDNIIMLGDMTLDEAIHAPVAVREIVTDAILVGRETSRPDSPVNWRDAKLAALDHANANERDKYEATQAIGRIKASHESGLAPLTFAAITPEAKAESIAIVPAFSDAQTWLAEQVRNAKTKRITRDEVANFLREHGVQVQTRILGAPPEEQEDAPRRRGTAIVDTALPEPLPGFLIKREDSEHIRVISPRGAQFQAETSGQVQQWMREMASGEPAQEPPEPYGIVRTDDGMQFDVVGPVDGDEDNIDYIGTVRTYDRALRTIRQHQEWVDDPDRGMEPSDEAVEELAREMFNRDLPEIARDYAGNSDDVNRSYPVALRPPDYKVEKVESSRGIVDMFTGQETKEHYRVIAVEFNQDLPGDDDVTDTDRGNTLENAGMPKDTDEFFEMYDPDEKEVVGPQFETQAAAHEWAKANGYTDSEPKWLVWDSENYRSVDQAGDDVQEADSFSEAHGIAEANRESNYEAEVDWVMNEAADEFFSNDSDHYERRAREELEEENRNEHPAEWDAPYETSMFATSQRSEPFALQHQNRYQSSGGKNYRELVFGVPNIEQYNASDSTHFGHVFEGRTIAWARVKEHKDAEGKRVLFVEELQSQRAQAGREEGFKNAAARKAAAAELSQLEAKLDELRNNFADAMTRAGFASERHLLVANDDGSDEARAFWPKYVEFVEQERESVEERQHVLDRIKGGGIPTAPFIEDTQAWTALVVKRLMRYAVDRGIDRIVWTPAQQQVQRYENALRKNYRKIAWKKVEGGIEIKGYQYGDRDGSPNVEQKFGEGELRAAIGPTMAQQIINDPGQEGSFEGDAIALDDLGMSYTYGDEKGLDPKGKPAIITLVANRIAKSLGAKEGVKQVEIPVTEGDTSFEKAPGFDITPEMADKIKGGLPLYQGERGQIAFDDDITNRPSTITLLKNADLSTFLHEMGHFQLEVLSHMAAQPEAPAEVRADIEKLLTWFDPRLTLEAWRAMPLEEKREHHEKFARGFEAYLFEGRSPNPELNGIFARFRAWLINVYKQLVNLKVDLTDEVRGVMDRLVATNEQILSAEAARNYEPLFKSAEEAGMTPEEWKAYHNLSLEATQEAVNQLQTRGVRDMRWLQNARGKTLAKLQKNAAQKRKEVEREVAQEVRSQPVYAVQRFLRYGELPEANRSNAERRALEDIAGMPTKLALPMLKEMYGDAPAAPWRYLPVGKAGLAATDGLHPDVVAELFGFSSGDELVRKILDAQPESAVIEGMTDQRMLERYGDLSSPESIERATDEALHNEARAKFVATELRMLAKATGQKNILNKAARDFAATIISRKKVKDIRPAQYTAAEARAAKRAEQALLKKNLPEAAVEKRNQLVNHYAASAAHKALDKIERSLAYLKRVGESQTIDIEYREQIDALLERFELRTITGKEIERRKSLTQWIEAERAKGNEPVIDPEMENEANRKPYQEMTLEEFNGLTDAVRNIEHLGRLKHKLLTAQDERRFEERVAEAVASVEENAKKSVPAKLERNSWTDKMADGTAEFFAMHRKFSSMIREMDGYKDGGVLWELFSRPMNAAGAREAVMREKATLRLTALMAGLKGMKDKLYIPAINDSLSREGRIVVALNSGNAGNLQRMMDGDNWTPTQVRAVIDTLTKPEMDFVQAVWDFIGEYRDEIGEQQRKLTGVEPQWVESTPVPTPHGTYRGGYFPVKYDSTRSTRALADEASANIMDQWRGARGQAKARDSFTKERADKVVDRPIRKDLGVLTQHVTEVTHRLAWQEFLNDAQRLLRAKSLDNAIREHYGHKTLEALRDTIEDIATGEQPGQNAFERGVNWLRTGTTVAYLGWRVTTSLLQPFGLTQSMVRIGPQWVARGAVEWLGDAARMENTAKRIYEKSEMMRLRAKTLQREISEITNVVEGRNSAIQASYFYLIQKMQLVADIPTWLGAYRKAVDTGSNEKTAVALADQAVLDAQGGGQVKDLAAIQRGGPLLKLFTNFYSFFSTTYQLTQESVAKTDFRSALSVGRLAVDMLLLYSVPAALGTLMKAALQGDDDEDKLLRRLIADQLTYLFGTMVGLREIAGTAQTALGLPGDYQGPASVRFFAELTKLGKQAAQGEVDEAALKAANNVGGILFHYPSGQVNATADGIYSLATGETKNPGALLVGAK